MYVCRMPDCMFYGMNSQWVEHCTKYWFKCPCCGEKYTPCSTEKDKVAAAYILQIVDPTTGDLARIPTCWPPSEEANWLNNQIELQARDIQTPADVKAWYEKSQLELKKLIDKEKIPDGLVEMKPDTAIDWRFSSQWKWEEFKQKSFWGNKFDDVLAARTPFSNWTELIGLIANTVASSRAIMSASL